MDAALAATALLMGVAGTPHCVAMCGAAQGAIARQSVAGIGTRIGHGLLALQAGRLLSYAAAGAVVAASVHGLDALQAAAPLLRPFWTLAHVGAVALGLWLVWNARAPAWLSVANPSAAQLLESRPVKVFRRLPPTYRAGLAGACWAAMPCGLLQSALLVAALASSPLQGAVVMTAFGAASAVGLWLGPLFWLRLHGREGSDQAASISVRLAGVLLAGSSVFALAHGVGSAAFAALCRVVG